MIQKKQPKKAHASNQARLQEKKTGERPDLSNHNACPARGTVMVVAVMNQTND
jgi:hypothetical protein